MMKNRLFAVLMPALLSLSAQGADYSLVTFGTVGYARSDQPYAYQRFISNAGSFSRDTLLGAQGEARFSPEWSATVQAKLAPSDAVDRKWSPSLTWAFLSWRPSDDWLLRAGKLRVPGYLNAENLDVGASYDFARLPIEMYNLVSSPDFVGGSFGKTWTVAGGELELDGYVGKQNQDGRTYSHMDVPGFLTSGPQTSSVRITARGLVLNWRQNEDVYKVGVHQGNSRRLDGQLFPTHLTLSSPLPGVSYYNVIPGAGVPGVDNFDVRIISLGADVGLGANVRFAGEMAVRRSSIDGGLDGSGGYVSLRRRMGKWTPYGYYARLRTTDSMLNVYQGLANPSVPAWFPNAAQINAIQMGAADLFWATDQRAWAIGTSYALSPNSKFKAEWARTRIGITSGFVDSPPSGVVSNQSINVLSLSYSFVY